MASNYFFIVLLAALWIVSFLYPLKRLKKKNQKRLLWLVRLSFLWWVVGMSYYLLGFLIPTMLVPKLIGGLLDFTLALPCRMGVGFENFRVGALTLTRFDLAWAMIWGLPFAFICSALLAALQTNIKKQVPLLHRSFRG